MMVSESLGWIEMPPGDPGAFLNESAAALFAALMIEALKRLGLFRRSGARPMLDPRLINLVAFGLTLLLEAVAGLAVYQTTGSYPLFAVVRAALVGTALATLGYEATKNVLGLLGWRETEDDGRQTMGDGG
ncbi:MAG: hypothetical protein C4311_06405 [Chloroflexota bacterium]